MKIKWCHGNDDSLRVAGIPEQLKKGIGRIWTIIPEIATYRRGPRGGLYRSRIIHSLGNPDAYRRRVKGPMSDYEDKGIERPFIEPKPFPDPQWCWTCGLLFEGGWIERQSGWIERQSDKFIYP